MSATANPIIGIYMIENIVTLDRYIGSSIDILRRCLAHRAGLRRGAHENRFLQNAWNKYGEESFLFGVVEHCVVHELLDVEREHVSLQGRYNISREIGLPPNRKGQRNSLEHREKCRIANLGKKFGPHRAEWNRRISEAQKGRPKPDGFGAHMSKVLTGRKLTPEHRTNISRGHARRRGEL